MGIRFYCPDCGRRLNIKAFLAGKRGICPHCDARVQIPLDSQIPENSPKYRPVGNVNAPATPVAAAVAGQADAVDARLPSDSPAATSADPIAETPDAIWYVRPPSGGQYGPARGEIMRKWLAEGRVSADSMVWREGWSDWQIAGPVFPALQPAGSAAKPESKSPVAPSFLVHDDEDEEQDISESAVNRRSRKKSIVPLIVLGLLIVVLLVVTVVILQGE
jgi:hypothetical protein